MIIHFSVLGVILLVSLFFERREKFHKLRDDGYAIKAFPFIVIFGYIAFLAAVRSGMNDTSSYIYSFNNIPGTFENIKEIIASDGKDKGFNILANLFKMYLSDDYHLWFTFFAVAESLIFVHILRNESSGILVSCFYFFASTLYYNYFSMMRQWFAITLFFFAFKYIKARKFIPYLIICLIAAQFHTSAYFCIVVYFFALLKPWSKTQMSVFFTFGVGMVFLDPILDTLENSGSIYDYVYETMSTNTGSSPVRILISAVPVVLSFVYRRQIEHENNMALKISVNMSILNLLLTILATFTSGLYLIRMSNYFNLFNMILFSWLLEKIIKGQNRSILKFGFFTFYTVFYIYQMLHQGALYYRSDILGNFN